MTSHTLPSKCLVDTIVRKRVKMPTLVNGHLNLHRGGHLSCTGIMGLPHRFGHSHECQWSLRIEVLVYTDSVVTLQHMHDILVRFL